MLAVQPHAAKVIAQLGVGEKAHIVGEALGVVAAQTVSSSQPLDPLLPSDFAVCVQGHRAAQHLKNHAVGQIQSLAQRPVPDVGEGIAAEIDLLEEKTDHRVARRLVGPFVQDALAGDRLIVATVPAQSGTDKAGNPILDPVWRPLVEIVRGFSPRTDFGALQSQDDRSVERTPQVAQQAEDETRLPEDVVVVFLVAEQRALRVEKRLFVAAVVASAVKACADIPLVAEEHDQAEAGVGDMWHLEAEVGIGAALGRIEGVKRQLVAVG